MLYETYIDGDLEFKGDVLVRSQTRCCLRASMRAAARRSLTDHPTPLALRRTL